MTPVHDIVSHTHDRADAIPQVAEEARPRLGELCSNSPSLLLQGFVEVIRLQQSSVCLLSAFILACS